MKFAKVLDDKVIDIITGTAPSDYVIVLNKWTKPTEYPIEFYVTGSHEPIVRVEGGEVHETWDFILKSINEIKDVIYDVQQKERAVRQKGSFPFDGGTVTLIDRSDAINIALLTDTANSYKVGKGHWITTPGKITQLKSATAAHVQDAYDWELSENLTVEALTTIDELKTYFETM